MWKWIIGLGVVGGAGFYLATRKTTPPKCFSWELRERRNGVWKSWGVFSSRAEALAKAIIEEAPIAFVKQLATAGKFTAPNGAVLEVRCTTANVTRWAGESDYQAARQLVIASCVKAGRTAIDCEAIVR